MAVTREALRAAVADYVEQVNSSDEVRRTLRRWECVLRIEPTDLDSPITITIANGVVTGLRDGAEGVADLIVSASAADLLDIFWGEVNPAQRYTEGSLTIQGPQEHLMRLDAMAMLVFLD